MKPAVFSIFSFHFLLEWHILALTADQQMASTAASTESVPELWEIHKYTQ